MVAGKGIGNLANMMGYNFRLGEIECAIGIEQLKKLAGLVAKRQCAAERLTAGLSDLEGLRTPVIQSDCTHAYYVYPIVLDVERLGVSRESIYKALVAEGVEGLAMGYVNLHLLPMYQQKIAYGSKGFPWTSDICHRDVNYSRGICPVAEDLHDRSYLGYAMCLNELPDEDVDLLAAAFRKVWNGMEALR